MKKIAIISSVMILSLSSVMQAEDTFENMSGAMNFAETQESKFVQDTSNIEIRSLIQLLEVAEKTSPDIQAAYYGWKSSLYKTGYSGSLADPMFTVGFFGEPIETRVGPQERRYSIKQQIPWFGNLGKEKNIAFAQSNIRYQNYLNVRKKVFYELSELYYSLYLKNKKITLVHENLKLLEYLESVAQTKYKVNKISQTDLLQLQMEIDKLNNELVDLDADLIPIHADINNHLNLTSAVTLTPDSLATDKSLDLENLQEQLSNNNRDLNAIKFLIEKETETKRLADKSSYPSFTIGADYIETGDALNPTMSESGKDAWMISVGINIPLWFSKNSSKKNEAEQKIREAEASYSSRKNQLLTYLEKLTTDYQKTEREIELLDTKLLPKSRQIVDISVEEYQNNSLDITDLLQYQRELLKLQYSLEESIVNKNILFEKIHFLTSK